MRQTNFISYFKQNILLQLNTYVLNKTLIRRFQQNVNGVKHLFFRLQFIQRFEHIFVLIVVKLLCLYL